jgi:hypothetical protein
MLNRQTATGQCFPVWKTSFPAKQILRKKHIQSLYTPCGKFASILPTQQKDRKKLDKLINCANLPKRFGNPLTPLNVTTIRTPVCQSRRNANKTHNVICVFALFSQIFRAISYSKVVQIICDHWPNWLNCYNVQVNACKVCKIGVMEFPYGPTRRQG